MIFFEFLFVLLVTLVLTAIFVVGIRRRTSWNTLLPFFMILFLATWATGIWISPIGPMIRGVFLVPFLFIGLLYALLLTAFIPPPSRRPRTPREKAHKAEEERETFAVLNAFFWLLIIGLIFAIIGRYLYMP